MNNKQTALFGIDDRPQPKYKVGQMVRVSSWGQYDFAYIKSVKWWNLFDTYKYELTAFHGGDYHEKKEYDIRPIGSFDLKYDEEKAYTINPPECEVGDKIFAKKVNRTYTVRDINLYGVDHKYKYNKRGLRVVSKSTASYIYRLEETDSPVWSGEFKVLPKESPDSDKSKRIRIAEAEAEAALALLELVKIGNEPKRGDVYTLPKKFEKPDAWLSASDKDRYDFYSVADVVSNGNIIVIDEQTYKSEWYSADEFKRAGFKFHHHQPDYGKVGGISGIERKNVEIHRRSKHGQMGEIDNFEERHALYLKLLNDSNYYDVMFKPENGGLKAVHYGHNFDKEKGHYEKEVMRYAYQNGYCVILENEQGKNIGENYTEGLWNEDVFELATCENANSNNNNIVNGLKHCASKDDTKTAILYFYKGVFIEADVDRAIRRYNGLKNTLTYYKAFTAIYIVDKWGNIYKMR